MNSFIGHILRRISNKLYISRPLVLACMLFLFFALINAGKKIPAQADTIVGMSTHEKTYVFDGKTYSVSQLLDDFMEVAFSDKPWPMEDGVDATYMLGRKFDEATQRESILSLTPRREGTRLEYFLRDFPWMEEFAAQPRSFEYGDRLHKWNRKKIRISFDWPAFSGREHLSPISIENLPFCGPASQYCAYVSALASGHHKDIVDHIQSVATELEQITDADLSVIMPGTKEEASAEFARIRIVFEEKNEQKNFFKFHRYGKHKRVIDWRMRYNEHELKPAVSFTTDIRSQVDGFLVISEDRSIGLSVCKIMPVVGADLMRSLLTECLVRSMGLPDLLSRDAESVLTNWNAQYDAYSLLKDLDGREKALRPAPVRIERADLPALSPTKVFDHLTEYDRFMLGLLYCDKIKTAATKQEARAQAEACLQ